LSADERPAASFTALEPRKSGFWPDVKGKDSENAAEFQLIGGKLPKGLFASAPSLMDFLVITDFGGWLSLIESASLRAARLCVVGLLLCGGEKCVQVGDVILQLRKRPHRMGFLPWRVARRIGEVKHSRLQQGLG
jgi:hypothetical protein